MTRRLINYIALWGSIFLVALLLPALCHSSEWRFDDGYNTWTVTIGHKVDYERLEKTLGS